MNVDGFIFRRKMRKTVSHVQAKALVEASPARMQLEPEVSTPAPVQTPNSAEIQGPAPENGAASLATPPSPPQQDGSPQKAPTFCEDDLQMSTFFAQPGEAAAWLQNGLSPETSESERMLQFCQRLLQVCPLPCTITSQSAIYLPPLGCELQASK